MNFRNAKYLTDLKTENLKIIFLVDNVIHQRGSDVLRGQSYA